MNALSKMGYQTKRALTVIFYLTCIIAAIRVYIWHLESDKRLVVTSVTEMTSDVPHSWSTAQELVSLQDNVETKYSVPVDKELCNVRCRTGQPCHYPDELDFRIIVLTFNRPRSLKKCLSHVYQLNTLGDRVGVDIWIDREKNGRLDNETVRVANEFAASWKRGRGCVHVQDKNAYITGQWIDTWRPKPNTRELALILEDDIDLSRLAYKWIKTVRRRFADVPNIAGYTLKMENVMSYTGWRPYHGPKSDCVFLSAGFGPWGFVPDPDFWRSFQDWYHVQREDPDFRPYVPHIALTKWYKEGKGDSVWELWFVYYCFVHKRYTLFPNLLHYTGRNDVLLDTNRMERGLHFPHDSHRDQSRFLMKIWSDHYVNFPKKIKIFGYDGKEMKAEGDIRRRV